MRVDYVGLKVQESTNIPKLAQLWKKETKLEQQERKSLVVFWANQ